MRDPGEIEAEKIARAFRPQWRPLAFTVGVNLLLGVLLLGVPYYRGQQLARAERVAFPAFVRCMIGGTIPSEPGLSLPSGERDQFAAKVLRAGKHWPLTCRQQLQALAPPSAIFLWPSVKQAGADMRAVVELVDREIVALHEARSAGSGRVPLRPLEAIAKLQAAATLMAKAAGTDDHLDNDAVRLDGASSLAAPARLPLVAGATAILDLSSSAGVLEALALDGRGVSWLRLDQGKIDRERAKRTGLVRGLLRQDAELYVVWATPEARCHDREDHCANRTTGLAAYARGASALPVPTWLGGHPAARPDRVLRVSASGNVQLIARKLPEGGLILRRFELGTVAPTTETAPPLPAAETFDLHDAGEPTDAAFIDGDARGVVFANATAGSVTARLASIDAFANQILFEPVAGEGPWITACSAAGRRIVAYGSTTAHRIARVALDASVVTSQPNELKISAPFDSENAALDHVRLLCGDRAAQLLTRDTDFTLWLTTCPYDGACAAPRKLQTSIAAFDARATASGAVIAWTGLRERTEIRTLRISHDGEPRESAQTPAACFMPYGGMCGIPTLIRDHDRIVLAAREGENLLVLESNDDGAHFVTLSGFKANAAFDPSSHDPMRQHRIRKGIE